MSEYVPTGPLMNLPAHQGVRPTVRPTPKYPFMRDVVKLATATYRLAQQVRAAGREELADDLWNVAESLDGVQETILETEEPI